MYMYISAGPLWATRLWSIWVQSSKLASFNAFQYCKFTALQCLEKLQVYRCNPLIPHL